jgi:two-component sensor histidine kinase
MLQLTALKQTVLYEIEEAVMPAKLCVSLALIANELVSNALKHGQSSAEVKFFVTRRRATLEVFDDGPGFAEGFDPIGSANIGLELVESLVQADLNGRTEFSNRDHGGGVVRVTFDLPDEEA